MENKQISPYKKYKKNRNQNKHFYLKFHNFVFGDDLIKENNEPSVNSCPINSFPYAAILRMNDKWDILDTEAFLGSFLGGHITNF